MQLAEKVVDLSKNFGYRILKGTSSIYAISSLKRFYFEDIGKVDQKGIYAFIRNSAITIPYMVGSIIGVVPGIIGYIVSSQQLKENQDPTFLIAIGLGLVATNLGSFILEIKRSIRLQSSDISDTL